MPDDPRVGRLLDELLDTHATPEQVCGSCVELLPVVRDRWRQMCHARAELDALFPPAPDPGTTQPVSPRDAAVLPVVPGYEVEAVLGLGGMGVVFRATHLRLNRVVALKMALAGAYAGPRERERFRREAEAVAAFRHPNVVQVYDVGDADGRPYFTMEFVEGGSLAERLAGTPQPARAAAALLATLAGAVEAAHRGGIVHRDLKPANVLLAADGTPKISDFGLARRLGGEAGLTLTGTAVGTPSYMAPEQARGEADAAGPAADVYALGAILYELLTGRPPFRAETAAETVHQLLTQDPVPPSRLNGKVPRDLGTICLHCLHKEPRLRYATAAALADDLGRFLRGEGIAARPERPLARLTRQVCRRPAFSAAVLGVMLVTATLAGGGLWLLADQAAVARAAAADQAATDRAADDDLTEMAELLRMSRWAEVRAALERAKGRLGGRRPAGLWEQLDRGALALALVARLEAIRLDSHTLSDEGVDFRRADGEYDDAFRRAGLGWPGESNPAATAEWVAASPVGPVLIAAYDHWAACCYENRHRQTSLRETVRLATPGMSDWWVRASDPATWMDEASLTRLIDSAPPTYPPFSVLLLIDVRMTAAGRDPVPFLRRAQQSYPDDFWVNVRLGDVLVRAGNPAEAVGYYRAALAVRPGAEVVQNNLGFALDRCGRRDEAALQYRKAADRSPASAIVQSNLVFLLARLGRHDEAIEQVGVAHRNGVRSAVLDAALGHSLSAKGRYADAVVALRRAVVLGPKLLTAQVTLRGCLMRLGQHDDARAAWAAAVAADPPEHDAWYGYAEFCLFLGRDDEYRRGRQSLLAKFGASTDPYVAERTARACLLLPTAGDELQRAAALADRAAAVNPSQYAGVHPYFLFVRSLADYRRGRFERAITTLRGDVSRMPGPSPRLVLAMTLHRSGQQAVARSTLAAAVVGHDWRADQVRDQDGWIAHVLRREAEGLILPDLSAFLEGKHNPRDNDERLALVGVCQATNRPLALARLYAAAFAAAPPLEEELRAGHRAAAARAAALAGCGRGTDATLLDEAERARWRSQARTWLRAALTAWKKEIDTAPVTARVGVWQRLASWRVDPDLAGLREPVELAKLPADERKDCLALWDEVGGALSRAASGR